MIYRFSICYLSMLMPASAQVLCNGWDGPVAPGFDGGSWTERWPLLLAAVLTLAAFLVTGAILRHVAGVREG